MPNEKPNSFPHLSEVQKHMEIEKAGGREKGKASLVSAWCCITSTVLFQLWNHCLVACIVLLKDYIKHLGTNFDMCSGDAFWDYLAESCQHFSILLKKGLICLNFKVAIKCLKLAVLCLSP